MNAFTCFAVQCRRELITQIRQPRLLVNAVLFFIMIIVFFPLTLPASSSLLQQFAPGLIWMAVLLAILLASERLFQQDYDDGVIEQWLVSGYSLPLIVFAKITVSWFVLILPLLIFSPVLAILFAFSGHQIGVLIASLVIGTPTLFCLCSLAAAFSTGSQQKGVFMALILLPLAVPILIFGSGMLNVAMQGFPVLGYMALLGAISLMAMAFLPFAIAAVIRISLAD